MQLFRIALAKYSTALVASGMPARWNVKLAEVIYTSQSRALACLENIVHRSSADLASLQFRVITIDIPEDASVTVVSLANLFDGWQQQHNVQLTSGIGNKWYVDCKTLLLKVPSALIAGEANYIINTKHPDFRKVKILNTEPFLFDSRL